MKVRVHKTKGYISQLLVRNRNVINSWSIEAADSHSAFRLVDEGLRVRKILTLRPNRDFLEGEVMVDASEGKWKISYTEQARGSTIVRNANLTALEDSFLMDFVIRYVFKKSKFREGEINGRKIRHSDSYIYYQYPVREALLKGRSCDVTVKLVRNGGAGLFKPVMYISDQPNAWSVHCRLLPKKIDKYVLKLCSEAYNDALPDLLAKPFVSIAKVRDALLYRGERKPYKRPWSLLAPNIYPMVLLKKGGKISLATQCIVKEHRWSSTS